MDKLSFYITINVEDSESSSSCDEQKPSCTVEQQVAQDALQDQQDQVMQSGGSIKQEEQYVQQEEEIDQEVIIVSDANNQHEQMQTVQVVENINEQHHDAQQEQEKLMAYQQQQEAQLLLEQQQTSQVVANDENQAQNTNKRQVENDSWGEVAQDNQSAASAGSMEEKNNPYNFTGVIHQQEQVQQQQQEPQQNIARESVNEQLEQANEQPKVAVYCQNSYDQYDLTQQQTMMMSPEKQQQQLVEEVQPVHEQEVVQEQHNQLQTISSDSSSSSSSDSEAEMQTTVPNQPIVEQNFESIEQQPLTSTAIVNQEDVVMEADQVQQDQADDTKEEFAQEEQKTLTAEAQLQDDGASIEEEIVQTVPVCQQQKPSGADDSKLESEDEALLGALQSDMRQKVEQNEAHHITQHQKDEEVAIVKQQETPQDQAFSQQALKPTIEEPLEVLGDKKDEQINLEQNANEDSSCSELDQKLLKDQASDQDFSDEQNSACNENDRDNGEAFEDGSDDMNLITVTNPILFTEHLAVMGRVPMMFFLPDVEESIQLKTLIEAHGGRCIEQYECSSYQIRPQSKTELDFNNFYAGTLYDEQWIRDSIAIGHLRQKDEYELGMNDSEEALKLNMGKRKKITIVEGMKLYKILGAQKFDKVVNDTYKGIERQGYLPERSIDTMKNFWKEYSSKTLEQYLVEAIYYKWDYCLSFKEIPNEEFEIRHHQQFSYEFGLLNAQDYTNQYAREGEVGYGQMSYNQQSIHMDEISSDSDDIFNDKVTDKLDEMTKNENKKFAALDKLTSPDNLYNAGLLGEQSTGATLINSASKSNLQSGGDNKMTSMINTCSGDGTKAFDAGISDDKRIDLSNLIESSSINKSNNNSKQLQNLPKLKKISGQHVQMIIGQKRTYSQSSALYFTSLNRPFKKMEQVSEKMKSKRFKRYTPQDREYPQFTPEELAKQLDVEVMSITVNEASYKDNGSCIIPKYYRTIVRKTDQIGKFKWLQIELEEMAYQYSKSLEELLMIFESVNCDKKRLRERLEGNTFCTWKKIEDLTLKNYYDQVKLNNGKPLSNSPAYQCLIEEKGLEEIACRNKFLGLIGI